MLNVAVVGAGGYSFELIKRIWQVPEKYNFVAVTSDPQVNDCGRDACLKNGVTVYEDLDTMLDALGKKVDLIFVPTSIHSHYTVAKRCIEAGYDIFVEKPPVVTIQDFDALKDLAEQHQKRVVVGFQYLYTDIVQKIKRFVVEGKYGAVKRVVSSAGWPRLDSYYTRGAAWGGHLRMGEFWVLDGSMNNPLSHMLANSLYLASAKAGAMAQPTNINAQLYRGHDIEGEDTSSMRIMSEDGVEIVYNATLCSNKEISATTVIECEDATIAFVDFQMATISVGNEVVATLTDKEEHRIYMLHVVADCFEKGVPCPGELAVCRPFTLSVNGAFESSGPPLQIDQKYINRVEQGDDVKTVIEGIDAFMLAPEHHGKILSEALLPWAKEQVQFDLRGYDYFPSERFSKALDGEKLEPVTKESKHKKVI